MNGWIKIHRKILGNRVVCKDADHLAVWMYLLLNASHNAHSQLYGGKTVELRPGQLITGRRVIGEKLNIEETKVKRILKLFQAQGQILIQAEKKSGSLIEILAWDEYQGEQQFAQINAQQNAPKEKSGNADKIRVCEVREEKSAQQNAQINAPKNAQKNAHNQEGINKNNNIKKTVPNGTAKERQAFFSDPAVNDAFYDFIEFRKQIRAPMTDRAITLAVNKLNTLSQSPVIQRKIIEQSIMNGWKGLFQLHVEDLMEGKFSAIDEFLKAGEYD